MIVKAPSKYTDESKRSKLIGAVHAEKNRRGIDESTYRLMLIQLYSVDSSKELNTFELCDLLDHMKGRESQLMKRAQYAFKQLQGKLKLTCTYTNGMAFKMFRKGIAELNAKELTKLTIALRYHQKRQELKGEKV